MSVLILFLPLLFLWASVWEVFLKILVILFVIIILKTVYFKVTFFLNSFHFKIKISEYLRGYGHRQTLSLKNM